MCDVGMINTYVILKDGLSVLTPSSAGRFCNNLVRSIAARDMIILSQLFGYELPSKRERPFCALALNDRERFLLSLPQATVPASSAVPKEATPDETERVISVSDALAHMPVPDTRPKPKFKLCHLHRLTGMGQRRAPLWCRKCGVNLCNECIYPFHADKL